MDTQRVIAALRELADALESSPAAPATAAAATSVAPAKLELADLQALGAQLLKTGKKSVFVDILATFGLRNLSSAEPSAYPQIYKALKDAANDEL